jgi:hypothetical protein
VRHFSLERKHNSNARYIEIALTIASWSENDLFLHFQESVCVYDVFTWITRKLQSSVLRLTPGLYTNGWCLWSYCKATAGQM